MENTKDPCPLKVSLHGMNKRIQKMMVTYLKLACNGTAQVVGDCESEVEIIDVDLAPSASLLQERKLQSPSKPLIVLSLQGISFDDDIIYIKKPLEVAKMLDALAVARKNLCNERGVVERQDNKQQAEQITSIDSPFLVSEQLEKQAINTREIVPFSLDAAHDGENVTIEEKKERVDKPPLFSMSEFSFSASGVETFFDRAVSSSKKVSLRTPAFCKSPENRRQTTRYIFRAINGHLRKKSLLGADSELSVLVLVISSKGALVRLEESLKLGSKVTLDIKFSLQNTFSIPAEVTRENNKNMYGLGFTVHQHELTYYLLNSGRPFNFK